MKWRGEERITCSYQMPALHIRCIELPRAWRFHPSACSSIAQVESLTRITQEPPWPLGSCHSSVRPLGGRKLSEWAALWLRRVAMATSLAAQASVSGLSVDDHTALAPRSPWGRAAQCPPLQPPELTMAGARWVSVYICYVCLFLCSLFLLFFCPPKFPEASKSLLMERHGNRGLSDGEGRGKRGKFKHQQ